MLDPKPEDGADKQDERTPEIAYLHEAIELLTAAYEQLDVDKDQTLRERIMAIADQLEGRLDRLDPLPDLNPTSE